MEKGLTKDINEGAVLTEQPVDLRGLAELDAAADVAPTCELGHN